MSDPAAFSLIVPPMGPPLRYEAEQRAWSLNDALAKAQTSLDRKNDENRTLRTLLALVIRREGTLSFTDEEVVEAAKSEYVIRTQHDGTKGVTQVWVGNNV